MSDRYTPAEALGLLVDSFDEELDGWSAIVADAAAEPARRHGVRGMPSLRRATRIRLALLVAGVAAAAALIITLPWKTTGPAGISDAQAAQILRNVQAAMTPRPGRIFHTRVRMTTVWTPTRKGGRAYLRKSTEFESWEISSPSVFVSRIRAVFSSQTPKQRPTITDSETKITTNGCREYDTTFDPATNTIHPLWNSSGIRMPGCADIIRRAGAGLENNVRRYLANGKAKVVARTRLDGEDVYRLHLCPSRGHCLSTFDFYVDARSYRPVREVVRGESGPGSGQPGYARCARGYKRPQLIMDFTTWEHLPPTAANLALTDLRKQHPDASVSSRPSFTRSLVARSLRPLRGCKQLLLGR